MWPKPFRRLSHWLTFIWRSPRILASSCRYCIPCSRQRLFVTTVFPLSRRGPSSKASGSVPDDRAPSRSPNFVVAKLPLLGLQDQISGCCRRFCEHAMVDGEERQLQPVGYPGLVVDAAQVVLDNLLGRSQAHGDFLIFAALNNERDNLHFLGGETVTDPRAHLIFFLYSCPQPSHFYSALTTHDTASAIDQCRTGYRAVRCAMHARGEIGACGLAVLGDHDTKASIYANALDKLIYVQFERGSE